MNKSDHGVGAPSRRSTFVRPEGGPAPFRHLSHVPSFRDNPIVFLQRDISIGTFDPVKILPKNGIMLNKTQ